MCYAIGVGNVMCYDWKLMMLCAMWLEVDDVMCDVIGSWGGNAVATRQITVKTRT